MEEQQNVSPLVESAKYRIQERKGGLGSLKKIPVLDLAPVNGWTSDRQQS